MSFAYILRGVAPARRLVRRREKGVVMGNEVVYGEDRVKFLPEGQNSESISSHIQFATRLLAVI